MMSFLEKATPIDFLLKTAIERDPKKRRVKPIEGQAALLEFDLGESSDDPDFKIEDHADGSDDDSLDTNEADNADSTDDEDSEEDSVDSDADSENNLKLTSSQGLSVADVINQAKSRQKDITLQFDDKAAKILICCACLGERSDNANEIVECDGCGVTVHEGCYGVSDTASISSTISSCSTEPWFCEACRAGVTNPICELCPNFGGIFKETDVGKWVHLVCALYVPGVAFGEIDQLTSVTLFEMSYSRWGSRTCGLCEDVRFARTGVCIGCDAGMCRTYFHVTCAQREGFLSEAHSEELDQADPFYAHCKFHSSDKTLVRRRKRNWLALQLQTQHRRIKHEQEGHCDTPAQLRIQRKLGKYRKEYLIQKAAKIAPWVPTQKMPRLLTTSASACRKLLRKAEVMGIDTEAVEMQEAHKDAVVDVRRKWHIPPAFSVEFIGYYLDRNTRLARMKHGLEELLDTNTRLLDEQQDLRLKYDKMMKESSDQTRINVSLIQNIHKYHSVILSACPNKNLPAIDDLGRPPAARIHAPTTMTVPTAAALKMGVGFPLNNISAGRHDTGRVLSSHASRQENLLLSNECGICRKRSDQHLLAKCDTCHLYYHLYCLNPPLTRLPKKSKLYGWQCSECDKTSDSDPEIIEVHTPRRNRTRYSKEGSASESRSENFTPKVKIKPVERQPVHSSTITPHIQSPVQSTRSHVNLPIVVVQSPRSTMPSPNLASTPLMSNNPVMSNSPVLSVNTVSSNTNYVISPNLTPNTPNNSHLLTPSLETHPMMITQSSSTKSGKKRRRDKHRSRYSPDMMNPSREHKRKRKKKSLDIENPNIPHPRITIKIKSIPLQPGEKASLSKPQMFYVPNDNNEIPTSMISTPSPQTPVQQISPSTSGFSRINNTRKSKDGDFMNCCVCSSGGTIKDTVQCDECKKCYHFTCLEPPVKKTPKRRGYSWHCADCDPTASDTN